MPTAPAHSQRSGAVLDTVGSTFHRGRLQCAAHVHQAERAGTIMLFAKGNYYTLPSGTATDLWKLLAEPRTAEEIITWIDEAYDAPREVITRDVVAQLARLRSHGLVVDVGADGEPMRAPRLWWRSWLREG
jgi:hypothetical protein